MTDFDYSANLDPDEADLVLAFLDQLRRDSESAPPFGLDPALAETIRRVVRANDATPGLNRHTKDRLWQAVQRGVQGQIEMDSTPAAFSSNGRKPDMMNTISSDAISPRRKRKLTRNSIIPERFRLITAGVGTLAATLLLLIGFGRLLIAPNPGTATAAAVTVIAATGTPGLNIAPLYPENFAYLTTQPARSLVWSPGGGRFAMITGAQGEQIKLYDETGGLIKTLIGHSGRINQIAWSPSGILLASAGNDNSVRLWTATGEVAGIISAHTARVDSVAWSPDGTILASASSLDGTIRLWKPLDEPIRTFQFRPTPADGMTTLHWSPTGDVLAARYSDNGVDLWTRDGRIIASFPRFLPVNGFAWSRDGKRFSMAAGNSGILVYSADGKLETRLVPASASAGPAFATPQWSADGRTIAAHDFMNNLHVWDVANAQTLPLTTFNVEITDIAYAPDGNLLAVSLTDRQKQEVRIEILDRALKVRKSLNINPERYPAIGMVTWSPDGGSIVSNLGELIDVVPIAPELIASARAVTPPAITIAPTVIVPPTLDVASLRPNDLPLTLGKTEQGELTHAKLEQGYTVRTDYDGKLLVLLQSDDFNINMMTQIACANGGGGGGGGGGGSGGSPQIVPSVIAVCKDGGARLIVTSMNGTETGRFNITAYRLTPEPLTAGTPIEASIEAATPYRYYTLKGAAGDRVVVDFTPAEDGKLRFTLDGAYQNMLPNATTSKLTSSVILRGAGEIGLLVTPATSGAVGKFRLNVAQPQAQLLTSTPQTVNLSFAQQSAAFRVVGGAKPILLRINAPRGSIGANITIQNVLVDIPITPDGSGGGGSGGSGGSGGGSGGSMPFPGSQPPLAELRIEPGSDLAYKLELAPDQTALIFIDLGGDAKDTLDVVIAAE